MVSPEELVERAKDAPPREPREDRGPRRDGAARRQPWRPPPRARRVALRLGSTVGGVKPPATLTDGVVALRELREGDRAAVLSTMRDPLVRAWLNMPEKPADADFDALLRASRRARERRRFDFAVTEPRATSSLGAVIASRRHRDNYELAYLARRGRPRARPDDTRRAARSATGCSTRGRADRDPDASRERGVAAARRACGFQREGASAGRSGCTAAGRTRSSGLCFPSDRR